jgi:hypothetical protein
MQLHWCMGPGEAVGAILRSAATSPSGGVPLMGIGAVTPIKQSGGCSWLGN